MKSHLIPDQQITASSVFKTWGIDAFTWHPHYARLDKTGKTNAWTALHNGQAEWLQVGLPRGWGGGLRQPPWGPDPPSGPRPLSPSSSSLLFCRTAQVCISIPSLEWEQIVLKFPSRFPFLRCFYTFHMIS